jgi:hypothetical protein
MKHARLLLTATLAVPMFFLLGGCGPSGSKHWPVTGKVTFQGHPVAVGVIRFSNPQRGIDITAALKPDGAYCVVAAKGKGLPEGTYQVAISPPPANAPFGPMKPAAKSQAWPSVPEKYSNPTTSGLTLVVKSNDNRFDVDMRP